MRQPERQLAELDRGQDGQGLEGRVRVRFECATTAGFADYRETLCALNNSLGPKKRLNDDVLTANYESALTRAGLQKDFDLKVIQFRQFNGVLGELLNAVTVECIWSVLHDTEALANAAAGTVARPP